MTDITFTTDTTNIAHLPTDATGQSLAAPIAAALRATSAANDWLLEVMRDEERQAYLIGDHLEAQRIVVNERARLAVANDHPAPTTDATDTTTADPRPLTRGEGALTLLTEDVADPNRLRARLDDAVTMASLTSNPLYTPALPTAAGFPTVEIDDPHLTSASATLLDHTLQRLRAAVSGWSSVRLSSAELYTTRQLRHLQTSRGVSGHYHATDVFLDFILIAHDGPDEAEIHAELHRRRLADLMLDGVVDAYATFARHLLHAQPPVTHRGPVMLSGEALSNLFGPLVFHASGQAAYQHISRFTIGEHITGAHPTGDALTLLSDGLRPWGVKTAPFDAEGFPADRVTLIENGVFLRPWTDARYATYLGVPPTGAFTNLTIHPGSWDLDTLRSAAEGPIYEIVSFSWMNPDTISGDFTVEIRLGYRHDEHGTTPIKGGTLSGNIFTALNDIRLSAATYSDGDYYGPAAIRFADLSIAGS